MICQDFLCYPALLELIFREMDGVKCSQTEIADILGVYLPVGHSISGVGNVQETDDPWMWGVPIDLKALEGLLDSLDVRYKPEFNNANMFMEDDFFDIMRELVNTRTPTILLYDYSRLVHRQGAVAGHASLLLDYQANSAEPELLIYDPDPVAGGSKLVTAYDMFCSMRTKNAGWLVLQKV